MRFNSKYDYQKHSFPEVNSGITMVEKAGYISAQKRIENMILAGQRLVDYRKNQFDFPDGNIDENFFDPTRSLNYDLADASQMQMQTEASIEASIKARQNQKEDLQEASNAEKEVNTPLEEKTPE